MTRPQAGIFMVDPQQCRAEATEEILRLLRQNRKVVCVMPTGGGKTVIGNEVAGRWSDREVNEISHLSR